MLHQLSLHHSLCHYTGLLSTVNFTVKQKIFKGFNFWKFQILISKNINSKSTFLGLIPYTYKFSRGVILVDCQNRVLSFLSNLELNMHCECFKNF